MRETTLSLLGLYNWDPTVLDLLVIPEELSADILVPNLLAETAELEILYPNPTVMKNLIGVWSQKQAPVWTHLYETTQYEYNPIENYNRYEEETSSSSDDRTGAQLNSGTDSSTGGSTDNATNKIAAFNMGTNLTDADGCAPQSKSSVTGTRTGSTTYGRRIDTTDAIDRETEREGHMHGNIGVMSTQDMIKQEREVADFNIYDIIIQDFIRRFCILVY